MKQIKTSKHNDSVLETFGRLEDKKYLCVMDLELTCWADDDPNKKPRDEMEITEIGVVILDAKTLEEVSRISKFVKPRNNPEITKYNTELTTITQDQIDSAQDLTNSVIELITDYLPYPHEFVWVTWGGDAEWLNKELKTQHSGIEFDPRYVNLKVLDTERNNGKSRGLKKALRAYKIEQEQPVHRAIADAVSTARLAKAFNITALDACISTKRTYKQALEANKDDCISKLNKRLNKDIDKGLSEVLLEYTEWNVSRASNLYNSLGKYLVS